MDENGEIGRLVRESQDLKLRIACIESALSRIGASLSELGHRLGDSPEGMTVRSDGIHFQKAVLIDYHERLVTLDTLEQSRSLLVELHEALKLQRGVSSRLAQMGIQL